MVKVRELIAQNKMLPIGMILLVLSFILSMITVMPTHIVFEEKKSASGAHVMEETFSVPGYPTQTANLYVNVSVINGSGRIVIRVFQANSTNPISWGTYSYTSGYSHSWVFNSQQLSQILKVTFVIIPSSYSTLNFDYTLKGYFYTHDYLMWISIPSFIIGLGAFFVGLFRAVVALAKRERERRLR